LPGATVTSKALPLSAVTVCASASLFMIITLLPAATVFAPEYLKSLIVIIAILDEEDPPEDEDGAGDEDGVDVLDADEDFDDEEEPPDDPHADRPVSPMIVAAAIAAMRVGVMTCFFRRGANGAGGR
jgi:hypothetical protein